MGIVQMVADITGVERHTVQKILCTYIEGWLSQLSSCVSSEKYVREYNTTFKLNDVEVLVNTGDTKI